MAKKLYHKIGDACRELDIQPYVLRYWETEFPFLKPDKSSSGQRVYTTEELHVIRRIKELLYDEGYTIAGAKKKLESELQSGGPRIESKKTTRKGSAGRSAQIAIEAADTAVSASAGATDEPSGELDTSAAERIQHTLRGLRELRDEARAILEMLRRPGT